MAYKDVRQYISALEEHGQLRRIKRKVDWDLEAGAIMRLVNEKSLYECGRLGNFVASRCVMKMGARTGLPFAKDLELFG